MNLQQISEYYKVNINRAVKARAFCRAKSDEPHAKAITERLMEYIVSGSRGTL